MPKLLIKAGTFMSAINPKNIDNMDYKIFINNMYRNLIILFIVFITGIYIIKYNPI